MNNHDSMCMNGASSEKDEEEALAAEAEAPPRRKQMPETRTEYFSLGRERDVNYVEELKKYVRLRGRGGVRGRQPYIHFPGAPRSNVSPTHHYDLHESDGDLCSTVSLQPWL